MSGPEVRLSPRFRACLRGLTEAQVRRAEQALQKVSASFGRPRDHSGISIRRLHEDIFECRAGLDIHLLFRALPEALEFFFAGDHDAVRRLIRSLK